MTTSSASNPRRTRVLDLRYKDACEEFNLLRSPDVIPKYAPDAVIGVFGGCGGGSSGGGGYTLEEAAKYTTKSWLGRRERRSHCLQACRLIRSRTSQSAA